MAERRMFHSAVVGSDAFMDLPAGAQALYFHLGMQADDDGFVNGPKQVARRLRRPPKELQMLIDSGFLLEFDGIVVLRHWRVANSLRTDRLKPIRYPDVAKQIFIDSKKEYTTKRTRGCKNLLRYKQNLLSELVNQGLPQSNLTESKGKEKKVKENNLTQSSPEEGIGDPLEDPFDEDLAATADTDSHLKRISGKLGKGVVYLSESQIADLLDKLDLEGFEFYINKLVDFIIKNQASVKNHYATILKWWQEDKGVTGCV